MLLLVCIGIGLVLIEVTQHQLTSMTDSVLEHNQERQQMRKQASAQQQAEEYAVKQRQADLDAKRARFESERRYAFDDAYIAPEGCEAPQSDRQFTECVNHKMRTKHEFFSAYGTPPYIEPTNATAIRHGDGL